MNKFWFTRFWVGAQLIKFSSSLTRPYLECIKLTQDSCLLHILSFALTCSLHPDHYPCHSEEEDQFWFHSFEIVHFVNLMRCNIF